MSKEEDYIEDYIDRLGQHVCDVQEFGEEVNSLEAELIAQGAPPEMMERLQNLKKALAYFDERNDELLINAQSSVFADKPKN